MDWNLKGHDHLGLSDFDEDPNPNMHLGSGGSGSFGFHGNFSVDLKLGHVVNNDDESLDRMKIPSVPKLAYSPSSKRARAVNNGVQTAYCLVDECTSDLSNCREYHRRHKVCEAHSKTPEVTIGGHKQRFCQQCSRFHSLGEFDEGKRSCRKRLDGHNRRRRKPQPEASHQHLGSLLPNYPGTRMFPFSTPDPFTMATLSQPTWPEGFRSDPFPSSSSAASRAFREEPKQQQQQPQFSLLCGTNLYLSSQTVPEASKFFCDGSSQIRGGSGRALSLLSSPSLSSQSLSPSQQQQASEMMRTSMSLNAPPPPPPPRRLNNYGGMRMDNNLELVMVPNGSVVDQGMFQLGPEVATPVETPQTLPFYWDG